MSEGTMVDASELATAPAIEQPTPEIENADDGFVDLDAVQTEGEDQGDGAEGQNPDEEFVEIERDGRRYSIPKELHGELMMHADYTRKTQTTAERGRELDAREQQIAERSQATDDELQARAMLMGMDSQLQQYSQLDWGKFQQDDPLGAQAEWMKFQQMKDARGQVAGILETAQKQRSEQMEQAIATRLQETADYAQKNIKGWTPDLDNKITEFATKELGFDVQQLRKALNPQLYRTMHLAYLGQQVLSRQATAPKPPTANVQPLRTVTARGNAAPTTDPADMSMEDYAKWSDKKFKR